jgi:hypothetical protein
MLSTLLARCGPDGAREHDTTQLTAFLGLTEAVAGHMLESAANAPPGACREALLRRGLAYVTTRAHRLQRCLLTPTSRRAVACGHLRPASGATLAGRVLRARARAARALGRQCPGRKIVERFLDQADCSTDDLISAAFPVARSDFDRLTVLGSSDSPRPHRLSAYFPCLVP